MIMQRQEYLDKLISFKDKLDSQEWYCGHFHIEKKLDKMYFMYESIGMLR